MHQVSHVLSESWRIMYQVVQNYRGQDIKCSQDPTRGEMGNELEKESVMIIWPYKELGTKSSMN